MAETSFKSIAVFETGVLCLGVGLLQVLEICDDGVGFARMEGEVCVGERKGGR